MKWVSISDRWYNYRRTWHKWFAWHPVKINKTVYWLIWLDRYLRPGYFWVYKIKGQIMPNKDTIRAIAFIIMCGGNIGDAQSMAKELNVQFTDAIWQEALQAYWSIDCENCGG